ncbi:carbohydrate ABC transporter permease [Jiella sonneratiae]|uniref:Sugar ABC transporter permease n=1 Tax=Jiella sonneratiae TaxID=2816856 RepID=A0ABS3J8V9_9HYPH|nr:sugar ABC transporter permease [Jiella sonneratiae]MBO0906109.1 sugar ABC transporter permease [Jiella sonneratiae]
MPHRTFIWFILPSALAMLIFIALPIVSILVQSLFVENERVLVTVENCGPFGCQKEVRVDAQATAALQREHPLGRFNGLGTYGNRSHLAFSEIAAIWNARPTLAGFLSEVMTLPFYRALAFTLAYTAVVTPLVIALGFFIALAVDALPRMVKGPVIFMSLLPMMITPLIGSLVLFWMIDSNGIIGASIQALANDPSLSLKASATLAWITLFVYGIWHSAPFAFVVFYAGLQTVPQDTMESAMIDGASRWERVRYVVLPHLSPLVVFVALIQLMDNFRVFEPIVGFSAQANATSLSFNIYNDLRSTGTPLFGSAAATSVLTLAGVALLLTPVLVRTWRDFKRSR